MVTANGAMATDAATARGAAYGFLASAFRYPDGELLREIGEETRWADWPEVMAEIDGSASAQLSAVRDWVALLK
ncbi:MAG: hypothetical protein ACREQL_15755, partial [Candidatus Binatia bacterium]